MNCDIDTTIPVSVTHFIAQDGQVFHTHGGVVSRIQYESIEEMPINDFFDTVAPTLKGQKDLVVFGRDSVHEKMYRLIGDTAVIYHGAKMTDIFLDDFYHQLQEDKPMELNLNLPYPLVSYKQEKGGYKRICVYIPEAPFLFQSMEPTEYSFSVWHPPLWLGLRLTPSNIPNAHRICVVLERARKLEETKLFSLPFPNVHSNGEICFGSTTFAQASDDDMITEADAIQKTYNRFFTSGFNHDLTGSVKKEAMRYQYEHLPKDEEIDAEVQKVLADKSMGFDDREDRLYFLRLSRCFKNRADVFKFPYSSFDGARGDF